MFADVLPKPFGQFGPGKWVFADHCGQRGVGLHGFTKGVFGGGGFLLGGHRAIRTHRVQGLAAKRKINRVSAVKQLVGIMERLDGLPTEAIP